MPSERDPRVDPRPGARIKRGNRYRQVLHRICNQVVYLTEDHHYLQTNIVLWRKWAANAEVIHHAD